MNHTPLCWLLNTTDPGGRVIRQHLHLSEFDFDIIDKKSSANTQADALSGLLSSILNEKPLSDDIPCFIADILTVNTVRRLFAYPSDDEDDNVQAEDCGVCGDFLALGEREGFDSALFEAIIPGKCPR